MLKSQVSDLGGDIAAGVVLRASSKGHVALYTKCHADTFEEITRQEWSDTVSKDTIAKTD